MRPELRWYRGAVVCFVLRMGFFLFLRAFFIALRGRFFIALNGELHLSPRAFLLPPMGKSGNNMFISIYYLEVASNAN
jgi:hypothetical protein